MPLYTFQGTTWNPLKGLFFNPTSTTYSNVVTGWVYDGTTWKLAYPSFPVNTVLPVITGVVAYNNTVNVNQGTWNTDAVFAVTNFAYQWLRDGVAISLATSSSYACVANDAGKQLSCNIIASNGKGSTTVVTAAQLVLPNLTVAPKYTDTTPTPGAPTSLSGSQGTNPYDWSLTFALGTNTSSAAVTQTGTGGSITYTTPNLTASGNSAGTNPAVVTVTATNSSTKATINGYSTFGATSYKIKLDSGTEIPLTTDITSYEFTGVSVGSHTVTVTPYAGTTAGLSNSVTFTTVVKTSNAQTNITVKDLGKIPTVTVVNGTATPGAISGATLTEGADQTWSASWTNGGNTTSVSVSAGTASGTPATSASGTATAGSVSVDITPTNTSKVLTASWAAQTGATKYLARIDSATEIDLGNVTSVDYSVGDTSNHTITVTPYANSYRGQSTQSAAVAAANVVGTANNVSGSWTVVDTVSPSGLISLTGNNFTWTTSGATQGGYSITGSNLATPSGGAAQSRGISGLSYNNTYTWTVTVYKSSTRTGGSTSKSTTFYTLYKPGQVTLNNTSYTGSGTTYRAFIQWNAPTVAADAGAATSYTVYASQGPTSSGPWTQLSPASENKTVFSTTRQGTVSGTRYILYQIYANNAAGASPVYEIAV